MTTETTAAEIVYKEREAGIYPSLFLRVEDFEFTDQKTEEIVPRWRWVFEDGDGEFDTLTSRSFRPRTNALKFLTGILGRAPKSGDKPADKYGATVNVVYGPNQNGTLTITDVLPFKPAK